METLEGSCLAIGESYTTDMDDILGSDFFDSYSDDDAVLQARTTSSGKVPTKQNGSDVNYGTYYMVGRQLAEIFSVRFLAFEELDLEDLYGVMLTTECYPYVIFERYFGDPLPIDSKGYVRMTGPRRVVVAYDSVTLELHLFNSRMMEYPMCSGGGCLWSLRHRSFDQLLRGEIKTDFGPVEVLYAVYKDSAEAILEVALIDWEGKGECTTEVQIFGTISARNSKVTDCRAQSLLFYKESEEALCIGCGDAISLPLSRKFTVLPLGSTLMVDFCIWHRSDRSLGGKLVEATVSFDSCLVGEEETIICGKRGKIKVKASWKRNFTNRE